MAALCLIVAAATALGLIGGYAAESSAALRPDVPTVVIDAGHGGIDNGVTGINSHTDEADINLEIAKYLKGQFSAAGFNCVMTRSTQSGLYGTTAPGFKRRDMEARKKIISDCSADLVISVHQNYCPLPSRRGGTVFFDGDSEGGRQLALSIQSELNTLYGGRANEALKGDYYMLRCTENPSVIVECGFLSNAEDDELLNDTSFKKQLAYTIFKGAVSYLSSAG